MNKDNKSINLSMLADYYEFTMANGYIANGVADTEAVFDMFFRKVPDNGGFAIAAGLEQVIEYIENLKFTEDDIDYFKSKKIFSEEFLDFLRNFKFTCDVWAVEEGTPVFPKEPIIIVKGPVKEAQIMETMILLTINYQSLIATKASRIVRVAKGRAISEFGSRRAQASEAAILGARAAYIGGAKATANTITDKFFGVPATGTMAHSWVQMYDTELEAFRAYAKVYPDSCVLLVDTYNTLEEGIPNAIKVFDELRANGHEGVGIRIDSGDLAYLSKKARKMLDEAGYPDVKIMVSNSLDEYVIKDLLGQGAQIDGFGVGERLITSRSEPVFGGVYKLVSTFKDDKEIYKIKISGDVEKITTPGFKKLYRLYDNETGKALADLVTTHDEEIDFTKEIEIFHPLYTWKKKTLTNYTAVPLLKKIFDKGKLVYNKKTIDEVQKYSLEEVDKLWDEVKRLENPHEYYVDLSKKLWTIKNDMLNKKH